MWCRSEARINGENCVRKDVRSKTCAASEICRSEISFPFQISQGSRLPTTAIGTIGQQSAGGNYAAVGLRKRGEKCAWRRRDRRKGRDVAVKVRTQNVGAD